MGEDPITHERLEVCDYAWLISVIQEHEDAIGGDDAFVE